MVSTATDGGTITNYSDRFTVTGMTGVTPDTYAKAAAGVDGTDGPETENNLANNAAQVGAGAAATGAGAAEYTVPYALQTGLTKYAPMQSVPPTKITLKGYTPLYPTSAYKIATAPLPVGTIATTITQSQTFSVKIQENTVSHDVLPRDDTADWLCRLRRKRAPAATWKNSLPVGRIEHGPDELDSSAFKRFCERFTAL